MSSPRPIGRATKTSKEGWDSQLPPASVLARFAIFVNGMARAAMLPFGPALVYRLVNGPAEVTASTWSSISFKLALIFVAFTLGYSVGTKAANRLAPSKRSLHLHVARLGGAVVSLHLFSFGAGLTSVFWLVAIRFASAVMVGILCSITDTSSLPQDSTTNLSSSEEPKDTGSGVGPGAAVVFLAGFAISILSGGLFYRYASADETIQALAESYAYTWLPFFLVGITIIFEIALRLAFSLTTQPDLSDHSSGAFKKIRRFARRIIEGKPLQSQTRVSFMEQKQSLLVSNGNDPLRPRTASYASAVTDVSDYFDCQSQLSDDLSTSKTFPEEDDIAQYVAGKCCYSDGSPAYIPPGDAASVIPRNYVENCNGDRSKALKMWQQTQAWRREEKVWSIHTVPNKFFSEIKRGYPHYIGGHSKAGLPVIFEQPGRMDLQFLFHDSGCTIDDMVHHYIFCQEYLCNCLSASKDLRRVAGKETTPFNSSEYGIFVVMDIQGAGLSMLNADILRYLKRVSDINAVHYPLSIKRVCVVNCPFWASAAASTITKVLPDSVTIDLLPGNCIDGLRKYIDDDQIPPEYGGSSPFSLGDHPYEKRLQELAEDASLGDIEANIYDSAIVSSTPANIVDVNVGGAELAFATENELPSSDQTMRRRVAEVTPDLYGPATKINADAAEGGVGVNSLAFVSFFCAFWSCAQGAIEIAVPLWLSSPVRFGGLGYTPSMSGATMFCAALVLLSVLSTRTSHLVSNMPRKDPLRALRIGLGLESTILFLLTAIPIYVATEHNQAIVTMSTVILFTFGAVASLMGRSSATILCAVVSDGLPPPPAQNTSSWSAARSMDVLVAECTSGRATNLLSIVGEIVGVLILSQVWALSIDRERPSKFDGSLCVFLPALMTSSLYFASYFLRWNATSKSSPPATSDQPPVGLELGILPGSERKAV